MIYHIYFNEYNLPEIKEYNTINNVILINIVSQLLKISKLYSRNNIIEIIINTEDKFGFDVTDQMYYNIARNGLSEIKSLGDLIDNLNSNNITFIKYLDKISILFKNKMNDLISKLRFQLNNKSSLDKYKLNGCSLVINGFYGSEQSKSFKPHTDEEIVILIPMDFNEGHKGLNIYNGTKEDPILKNTIKIERDDIIIMEEGIIHDLNYFGRTDMLSIGLECDLMNFVNPGTVERLYSENGIH